MAGLVGHEANDGKYDEARKHGGAAVGKGNQDGISVAVVAKFVVRGKCDQSSKSSSQGVEDLCCSIRPNLNAQEVLKLGRDIKFDAFRRPLERSSLHEKNDQN